VDEPLLEVEHLIVGFDTDRGPILAVDDVSFAVRAGETLALVGESGSGKSLTAYSVLRAVPPPGRILGGTVRFRGRDLLTLPEAEMRRVRGAGIALIFQEPSTALNPVLTVGDQIAETMVVHGKGDWKSARARAIELLADVKIANPAASARDYPHQLSGGQRQRVLIAMAMACAPAVIIADEPTTALDMRVQADILDLLREARARAGLGLLLITHDFGVVASIADRVAVMYAGRIVEEGTVDQVFHAPGHPYTRGLLASIPRATGSRRLNAIDGVMPSPGTLPRGCAFEPRCPDRRDDCQVSMPSIYEIGPAHRARCVLHESIDR
jgi:oligopeptide/dipeptide ABC transporter ATP-binding protein